MKIYKAIFLDRDGVINIERKNDYAKNIDEFVFEENALNAITILSKRFKYIFVVTNQRGVGRGIMTSEALDSVHEYMLQQVKLKNGKIDKIYTCIDTQSTSINRKPNVGMAFQIQRDFPEIDFQTSIMVGNSKSDIEFGKKLGMHTVLVGSKYDKQDEIYNNVDAYYMNLYEFALSL